MRWNSTWSPESCFVTLVDEFLGLRRCDEEKTFIPQFDGRAGSEIDTCWEEGHHRNAFVEKDGLVYLLTTEPAIGYGAEHPQLFRDMLRSFRWLGPLPANKWTP